MSEPHSSYGWSMASRSDPPGPALLRLEDPSRPGFGDLIAAGCVVRTSYGTGPYRVSTVTRYEPYPGVICWSIYGLEVVDGVALKGGNYGILNELVVEWDGDQPRFRKLFQANEDEVFLDAAVSYVATRKGQLELF